MSNQDSTIEMVFYPDTTNPFNFLKNDKSKDYFEN